MKFSNYAKLALISMLLLTGCEQNKLEWHGTDITGIMPDLAFSLENEDGQIVDSNSYAGKINILFFGYTHCPDVCPLTLGKLATVLRGFPKSQRQHFNVLFVSVDPARDTASVRKEYAAAFGPDFSGLSGKIKDLKALNRRYRVTFGYGKKKADGQYLVSHSSAIYVFDPNGSVRLLLRGNESVNNIAADLQQLLEISSFKQAISSNP